MNTEIQNKANEIVAKFPHMSMEQAIQRAEIQLSKKGWRPMSAKEVAKMECRNSPVTTSIYAGMDMAEINRANTMQNLPSSMRKF